MSYYNDWKNGTLEANELDYLVIIDGNNEIDITNDVSISNFIISDGENNLYDNIAQETVSFEINNATHRYDNFALKGKKIRFSIKTPSESGSPYYTTYREFYISGVTYSEEHVQVNCLLFDMSISKVPLDFLFNSNNFIFIKDAMVQLATHLQATRTLGYDGGTWLNGEKYIWQRIPNRADSGNYYAPLFNNAKSNGDLLKQFTKILGGYAHIKRPYSANYPSLYIKHFPTATLKSEAEDNPRNLGQYVYGGTFDEVVAGDESDITLQPNVESESIDVSLYDRLLVSGGALTEDTQKLLLQYQYNGHVITLDITSEYLNGDTIDVSEIDSVTLLFDSLITTQPLDVTYSMLDAYNTGDSVDGNSIDRNGGTFDIGYTVIDDNVITDATVGNYYQPQTVLGTATFWRTSDNNWESYEVEVTAGQETTAENRQNAIDLTGEDVFKSVYYAPNPSYQKDALYNILNEEVNFPSATFEVTVLNNLKLEVGQVVAIQTGVAPTRFSYIEKINTDLFGATTISNSRGE